MSGPDEEVALRLTREEVDALVVLLRDVAMGSRILMTKSTTSADLSATALDAAQGCERIVAKIETQAKPAPKVLAEAWAPIMEGGAVVSRQAGGPLLFDSAQAASYLGHRVVRVQVVEAPS